MFKHTAPVLFAMEPMPGSLAVQAIFHCKKLSGRLIQLYGVLLISLTLLLTSCKTTQNFAGYAAPKEDTALHLPNDYIHADPFAQPIQMPNSRWVPAAWSELPQWDTDTIGEAWNAWQQSCQQPIPTWENLCKQVIALSQASEKTKRQWMYDMLQPYRVEFFDGRKMGTLTAYYEPVFRAQRLPGGNFTTALFQVPPDLPANKPSWTRQQIESDPQIQNRLIGYELAYLADPLEAMILHIQGSGQLIITEPDGNIRRIRATYAASNNQKYQSIGRYMLDQKLITDATWPGIKQWLDAHPQQLKKILWINPRYIFFKETAIDDPKIGPVGAQGVPLTPGRSIAVDKSSIPYGTPVWISSQDPNGLTKPLNRLVLAQDTGAAITGAVRADYFWGQGAQAGEQAGHIKQNLYMWTFLPRTH